jgi:hypothetical protein
VFETLGESGHARLLAWSALGDFAPQRTRGVVPQEQVLRVLADAVHRRLGDEARATGARTPPREEADFTVRLVAAAMLGDALVGDVLSRTAGLPDGPAVQRRFRAWLARLLDERFRQVTCTTRRGGRD